jgi:hypothetical protein
MSKAKRGHPANALSILTLGCSLACTNKTHGEHKRPSLLRQVGVVNRISFYLSRKAEIVAARCDSFKELPT